jgi:hypothetical protein
MNVLVENNKVAAYKVNMAITFVLKEGPLPSQDEAGRGTAWRDRSGRLRPEDAGAVSQWEVYTIGQSIAPLGGLG